MPSTAKRPVIERLLSSTAGESWYGDGHPTWSEGTNDDRPSLSRHQANAQRLRDVKMLRRHCKMNKRGLHLADLIESCEEDHRCLSGACIACNRAAQRLFVEGGGSLLRKSAISVTAVSIVFKKAWVMQGTLANPSDLFELLSQRLSKALVLSGVRRAFGGFDVSVNERARSGFSPHYRPHAYIFIPTQQFKHAERRLREFFPASSTVRRPVVAHHFDGRRKGLAYAFKRDFQRRVTLPRQTLPDGSVRRRNTRDRPLRAQQKVELGLALNRLGLGSRVFLHGLRIVAAGDKIRIVRSTPESRLNAKQRPHPPSRMIQRSMRLPSRRETIGNSGP
jgi:hypothetical protein